MKEKRSSSTARMTADERREVILDAALPVFAAYGLHGASTIEIAARATISETYIFRLFGTKKELFIAVIERVHQRFMQMYQVAAEKQPDHPLAAIRASFLHTSTQRDELLLLLQAYAASSEQDVQRVVRERFLEMYGYVERIAGAQEDVRTFFAYTMFAIVANALEVSISSGPQSPEQQE